MTEEDAKYLAALKKAYNSGVLQLKNGETTTTFRSLNEMERIINRLERGDRTRRPRYISQPSKDSGRGGLL